jgi:hypothetical protein
MKIPTLNEIVRDKLNIVIHTLTIEDVKELLKTVPFDVTTVCDYNFWLDCWDIYKENTCYRIEKGIITVYCDTDYYIEQGYNIYKMTDLGEEDAYTITIEKYNIPKCSCGFKLGEYLEDGYVEIFKNPYEEITDTKYGYLKRCPNCGQLLDWKYANEED